LHARSAKNRVTLAPFGPVGMTQSAHARTFGLYLK